MALIDEARRRGLFDPASAAPSQYVSSLAAHAMAQRPAYRAGGLIEGPGTEISDSIPAEVPEGTYILPADTTRAVGLASRASDPAMPVALSDGEFEITPEQLQSIGAAVLDILRGVTHTPVEPESVEVQDQGYANGGQVAPGYRMDAAADPRSTVYGSNNPYAASNTMRMSGLANSIGSRGVMELGRAPAPQPQTARNSFGDAAAATVDPMVTQLPQPRRPGYADGGLVTDEERRQNMLAQIPTGGMTAPAADGSQNNPLNTELGRNALNTLSALPGATGLAARATGGAARGASAALSAERVIPAAWEVVQDGGALASRTAGAANPAAGALTRAASLAPDVAAVGAPGRAAQMLGGPPGQLVRRPATPLADVVEPLALGGAGAGQAGAATAQGLSGLGRMAAAGGAGGLAAAAMLSGDSPAGVPGPTASNTAPTSTAPTAQPRSLAAEALMGPPMSASGSITRDGNSYSGPANISGDVTFRNPDGSLRQSGGTVTPLPAGAQFGGGQGLAAAALGGTLPGGGISAQSMGAADALAAQSQTDSMGRLLASGQIRAPQAGPSMILPGGSFGIRRANSVVSGEQDARRSFDYATGNDPASRTRQAALQQTALKEQGDTQREIIKAEGLGMREMLKARQSGKAPEGYRWTATGGLEAIPGGPAAAKVADQQQTKEAGFDATRQTIGTINRLLANTNGLQGATGMIGVQRFFPGTDAADFASQVETLKAQTFLPMVQQLRGMGALSNAEGDKLNAAVGALNFNMSEKAFAESLGRIRDQLGAAMQKAGYDTRDVGGWGLEPPSTAAETASGRPATSQQQAVAAGQPARPTDQAAFAALPSGTRFIAPDGSVRVKP